MPERRKIKTSKHKVVSSTPRKGSKVVRAEDVERDSPFDDFNILDTSTEAVCVQPEFDDGTSRPVFQMKLEKTVVEEGASAQMECVVAGIPPPKVLWLKNNRPLMATDRCRVIVDGDTNILEFPRARADDTAVYTARAMNVNGSTISTAELYVGDAQPSDLLKYREGIPDNEFRTPAYFFQMKNCQVEEGRLARFDCRVVAYPKPDIIWMKDGKVLTSGERFKLLNFNDEIYSLLIQSVETDDEGRYTCWAHNKYGEAMTEAYLNVLALHDNMDDDDMAPKFLTKFYDQTVTEGVPCDLQCMIAGKPQPSVQWLHNNNELIATPEITIVNQANFCSVKIKEVSKNNAGKYACLLKNGLGEASCSAGITVIDKKIKGVPMLPKFLKKLCDVTAKTNEDFEFEVVVVGEPKPKITWQYNHKPISGSHRRMRKSHEGDVYRLTISDVRLEDDGKFTCKAANSEGEVYCSCNLLVKESRIQLEPAEEPSFTQKDFDARYGCAPTFLKKMEDVSMPSGQSAKFECRIMGIPEPSVKWFKNGVPITQGKKYWTTQDSAGNCGLQVYDVSAGDEGIYTCTLTNPAGEISTNASLRIGKPKESMERDFPSKTAKGRRLSREDMLDSTRAPTMSRDEPTIKSTRPDTVRLSWAPAPTSGLPKEACNIRYIVESKALPNADWKTIGDGIHSNTYMAKNLNPDKEYAFRVRAENQFGQSDPTQPARLERIKLDEKIEKKKVILPESKRPPSLPSSRPVITDYGQESVRLAWKPAPPPATIKKPLPVSYRVEAQELPSTDWLPMASGLSTPSYYLPQLQDRHDYNIRVRAENKYGVSEPSEPLWLPRAHSFPGVPIRRPEIIEMEPEFVKLSWERVDVPPTALDEEPLTYMIEMQEPASRDWREIAQDIREPHYTVRDLRPGNDYRFRVRSRSLAGPLSEPSPATSLYRTLATTRVPIDRIQLDDHEFDTEGINLSWNRVNITPYHRDDEPLLYSVEMMEQPIEDWRPIVSGIPTQRYRVTDLAPDRDYKFRVRALSSYGISPPSYALPVSYRRPLPSPSRPLVDHTPRLLYDDTDSLSLAWKPPTLDSTRPLRYRVQMQAPPSMDWRTMASDIPDTRYRISGLGPSRDYMFRVVPETSLGQLDPLPPVSLSSLPTPRTFHPSRPEILDIEPTSLGLSWKRPVVDMHTPLTYNIEMQEPPSLSWRTIHSGLTDTHYRVGGLQPSRDYLFRIVPVTTSGQLEPLPPVSISSMPVIPRMQNHEPSMTEIGRDSIKLSWRPAEIPFYRRQPLPLHYTVEMRTLPSSEWIPVARRVKDNSYIVKGLNPKNDYEFRVKAETDYGCSSPTYPVIVRRKPVPVFPRREPVISNVSPDSITLSWQPATLPGHSTRIPVYQIEVQDPPSIGQWRPLTNNVSQTSYNVVGLRPDRDYLFRVRAKVDGTLGEPTLPVYLMRRCGPPRMPTDHPYVHDIQPTSVRLQWRSVELSPRHTDYSPVTYRLEVQEGTRSDWVTLAGRIPHTDFHVTNLTPDQEYSFRVRAENKYGVSEPTNLVHVKRRAVAPTLPQDEPLLYDVGAGSITLSWRSAEVPSFSTSPVTYSIFVQESPSSTWTPMVRRIPHTWYVLNGIRPDRDYTFRIQAENEFGVSRPTLPVRLFHTGYKAPIELPEIDEFDEKSSSINLRWRPRSMTPFEGEPLRYHVESWEPRKRTWRRLASDIPDTSYRVTGISSNQENIFRVRAQTKAALSEPTYPISLSRYLFPIRRPQLHDLESEAVRLSWSPYQHSRPRMPSLPHLPSIPRRYEVELRELGTSDWKSIATVPDTSFYYRGLRPRQDYQFRVRGISDQGPLDVYSTPVTLYRRTALPRVPLPRPEIMSVQDETVDLSWSRVDIPATQYDETPLTYIIESQQLPGYDWTPVARGISDTSYRVTGLRRNQDYAFRVRGELPSGLSEPSPYVPVYRRPIRAGVPIARPELSSLTPSSAHLRWNRVYLPPYDLPDRPISYQVEVQDLPHRRWRPLARGIRMEEYEVKDMAPDKDYMFRIRAETPDGDLSEPTPPIPYYRTHEPREHEPRRQADLTLLKEEFSVPNRSYVEHLTTYIPPRLPIDKPELREISQDTVSLSWKPAKVPEKIRSSSNLTYVIECRTPPNYEWRELKSGLTSTSFTLNNLHPRMDYMFRVRAHNQYGFSEASLPISLFRPIELDDDDVEYDDFDEEYRNTYNDTVPHSRLQRRTDEAPMKIEEAPPKLPMETPRITDHGESAHLTWLPARIPAYAKKTPITYIVEVKEPPVQGWARTASGIVDTSFMVEGILPNRDYQFRIRAETQFGTSDPTLSAVLDRTKEKSRLSSRDKRRNDPDDLPQAVYLDSVLTGAPPRMPSSRPMITNQAGNLLTLAWLPGRVPSYVKGSNMTYLVEMRKPPSHLWLKLIDNVEETEFDVYDLQEDQDYMFRVKAKNEFGCSEPTMPLSIVRNKDDYIGTAVLSRSGSRGSLDSPWTRSRASSVDSLLESMPTKACKPEFKLQEDTFYGAESRPVTISLQVKGFPLPKVRWYFQGKKLKLGNRYKSFITPNGNATLEFSRMSEKDVGEYKCRAENEQGMSVRIFNLEMSDAPTFLEPLRNIVVDHRGCAKLECRVDGIPLPTVKFMRDWRPVAESSRVKIVHEAPDYWCLTIENTMSSDCGQYQCVAENVSGKAVSSAKITVEEKSAEERVPHSPGLHYREAPVEDFYYILEELGRGRHGVVRRVLDKSSGKQYAAKFIPVADPEMKHFFRQELYNLRAVSHKNVVGIVDAFQSNRSLVIITELASGGELLDRVLSLDNWTESDAAFFIRQLLEVLNHLHQHQVYHLDIKPSNIMLSAADSDEIKLIDFGLSRRVLPDQSVRCNYGTPEFTSPEQVCNEVLSSATDIWSVGALAYLLVSGISAFQDRTDKDILSWVETCDWEFDDEGFELVSKEAKDFINKLLVLEPSERLTLEECMQHAWIRNATNRGQGPKLNIENLATFHKQNKKERLVGALQTCARVQSLKAIINDDLEEEDTGLYPLKDKTSGEMIYPDSQHYGKFLDQESWADWQVRYHQGGDTILVPLAEPDYTARVREYKEAASESDYSEEGSSNGTMKERRSVKDVEKEYVSSSNPCLQKELEWALVAEEFKQQQQTPEELFDKEQVDPAKLPLFATKLRDHAFMPGETVTLTCRVQSEGTPSVNWFRNEEQVSEGNRLRTSLSEDGTATLTIELSKPFDEGVYKCVARNQAGKSTSWARVLVGGVTEEPGRPVVVQVSGSEALLVWEPPMADCNTPVTGYRVDYRKFGDESWTVAANVIDECCLVTGLLQGRSYRFRVSCVNKFGISPYSVASTEVKMRTDPDAKITVDKYMAALLARQREVETRPSPASSRKGSEVNSMGLTLMEGSPEESYSFLNTLYSGGFSDLVCCRKSDSNTLYLGKIVPVQPDNMDATKHEYEILKTLCHERIVSMYECFLYKDSLYMILEFLYGLNVIQHLSFKTKYSEDMVARVLRQVLDGVEYLQHQGVVHLNLQPSSVVMVSRRHLDIKLVDFSLARKVTQDGEVMTIEGFPEFIAPEVLAKEPTSFPADIWTIGTLAFLLLSGESPFAAPTQKDVYSNIVYNRYDAHGLYENATREALKFVFQILKRTPRNRLTATRCLEDKWLQVTDVMTKCRKDVVFSTSKLRTFSRRYLVNRALEMYPMIHEETPTPISEEPEFDEEVDEEEEPTSNVVLDETEETSLKEHGSEEQPISNEVASVNLDEPIENDVIPESEESKETEVTLALPEDSVDTEGKTVEGIEQLANDIVSSAIDEALQKPEPSSGDVNGDA